MAHAAQDTDSASTLVRVRRAVMALDLVESVRLMQCSEDEAIVAWRALVQTTRCNILPGHRGTLVKSLGDGLLLTFETTSDACSCALAIEVALAALNHASPGSLALAVRIGVHVADIVVDELDIYGAGVNLAARLASLGRPGDVVLSSEARDELLPGLDVDVEDMGDCYLKHIDGAVRAWRLVRGASSAVPPWLPPEQFATVAVLPCDSAEPGSRHDFAMATVVADELAGLLACCSGISVIARPTVAAVTARRPDAGSLFKLLRVPYVVRVACRVAGGDAEVCAEVLSRGTDLPVLRFECQDHRASARDRTSPQLLDLAASVANVVAAASQASEADRALPQVESYALLLSAIARMHRMSLAESERAKQALDELATRHPRAPEIHAWSAKWHMLRVAQGWTADASQETAQAVFHVRRAEDAQPGHALATAIEGQIELFRHGNLERADQLISRAVAAAPSEPLAWLFYSNLRAHQGQGDAAIDAADKAMALSPLDPTRFMFEMFAAQAALCAGMHQRAQALAAASLRGNSMHLPTYPAYIIASVLTGDMDGAREGAQRYLRLAPKMSARRYAELFRGPQDQGRMFADALRHAGLPQ
ncbi:MAG TPA: adenylate/guanylate cyclase domain-containing protein [Ideonella sp.]|uniref:adenylate/guanylate cyclase domain-containing protein n=1 Tax=Ideonella sp. TaxID=1929293 RepID=UPI002E333AE1|nr:adenylate/guanylate cyclase domain-containing protein [Ideonella sp.]HEX5683701.1 adenylate/guanylate cyclase domain-containing protein [Ideonella sp.]